jgi:hypothetical protein
MWVEWLSSPRHINLISEGVKDHAIPRVEPGLTTCNQDNGGVNEAKRMCPLPSLRGVRFGSLLANLPFTPDLVSETPVFYLEDRRVSQDATLGKLSHTLWGSSRPVF